MSPGDQKKRAVGCRDWNRFVFAIGFDRFFPLSR